MMLSFTHPTNENYTIQLTETVNGFIYETSSIPGNFTITRKIGLKLIAMFRKDGFKEFKGDIYEERWEDSHEYDESF